MITISLCMIVKDEEKNLQRCLDSCSKIMDEIIIVDTGSTDNTKKIAKKYTKKLYDFMWEDDFSKARNFSFSKAKKDYILWLDADDVISKQEIEKIVALKKELDSSVDIVMMKYNNGFDENDLPTLSYYRERLVKRSNQYRWEGEVHEVIVPTGKIEYSEIAIEHRPMHTIPSDRNLRIYQNKLKKKELSPREQFYYARELYYNEKYREAILQFNLFLDSKLGWKENSISACIDLAKCYSKLEQYPLSFQALLRSFEFDKPRAEVCCEIGNYLMADQKQQVAIFWYELATTFTPDYTNGGFYLKDYYDFIPYLQLCLCHFQLGNNEQAILYNEHAGKVKPSSNLYLSNKKYFESLE